MVDALESDVKGNGKTSSIFSVMVHNSEPSATSQDMEISIDDCLMTTWDCSEKAAWTDASESTSSFSHSLLDTDYDIGEAEVESKSFVDPNEDPFFFGRVLEFGTRKNLTAHWRRFIHPLKWRCKWLELQLRELKAQTRKYDTLLAERERKKQLHVERNKGEHSNVKSLSLDYSGCTQRHNLLKRKRRIRCEETTDLVSYMKNHSVFSYFGRQKTAFEVVPNDISHDRTAIGNHDLWFEGACWHSLEDLDGTNSDGEIMNKIDVSQMLVRRLRARVQQLLTQILKFPSVSVLTLPVPSAALIRLNEMTMSPSNDTSIHGKRTTITDIFESIAMEHAENSSENAEDDILIHNEAGKEEMRVLRNFGCELEREPSFESENHVPKKRDDGSPTHSCPKSKPLGVTKKGFGGRKKGTAPKRRKKA